MSQWTTEDIPDVHGYTVLVTGANSGLGLETTRALATKGAHVVMACRNLEKGRAAQASLEQSIPGASLSLMHLDLASLASVRTFAERLQAQQSQLHLLFNNAGVMALPYRKTTDGFEWQFGTNYLGHFALTGLVLPTLLATPKSRVISTSSLAQMMGKISFDNLNGERSYSRWSAYGKSKLATAMFAFELQRRLKQAGAEMISVCAHPGYSATNLQTTSATESAAAIERLIYSSFGGVFQNAAMGALPQLYAATSSAISGGEYIGPDGLFGLGGYPKEVRAVKQAYDEQVAAKLWEVSVEMTGVDYAALRDVPALKA